MVGNMNFGHVFFCHLKGGKLVGFQEKIYIYIYEKTVFKGSVYTFLIYIYIDSMHSTYTANKLINLNILECPF